MFWIHGLNENSFLKNLVSNVKYRDKDITTIENDNEPRNLGSAIINENMTNLLKKPPGYSLYKNITEKDVDLDVEEGLAKLRWSNLEQERKKNEGSLASQNANENNA